MVDKAKLNQLMSTQTAADNQPPVSSMTPTDAASWCNGNGGCRRDVPVNEFAERIGDARKIQGTLKAARAAHDDGSQPLETDAIEACDMFLTYCGQNVSAGAITVILAKAQADYDRLVARCDALMAANPPLLTADDKAAILALPNTTDRLCDLDPATVDLPVEERQTQRWLDNSRAIGWAHVQQTRSYYSGRSVRER